MTRPVRLRLGTRGSELALHQARLVERALSAVAHVRVDIVVVRTAGDDLQAGPRWRDDTPGLFTTEIEQAVDRGDVDAAVHSLKDLPTGVWSGTVIAAVLERGRPEDAIVSVDRVPLAALRSGAVVGTSSLRRKALVQSLRPDVEVVDLRGNVPTRLARVRAGELDAAVLAVAGLERLGRDAEIAEVLPPETFVPAPGQGAIAVQARARDREIVAVLSRIAHAPTQLAVTAERACLAAIESGCQAPVGAFARADGEGRLVMDAFLSAGSGARQALVRARDTAEAATIEDAARWGANMAARLLGDGRRSS